MSKSPAGVVLVAGLCSALLVGYVSQAEFLNNNQSNATQAAMSRAQFELNCHQVTPTIISREVV